jgi:YhcH/YjgK/YiaL family protein
MIIDKLSNIQLYSSLLNNLDHGLRAINDLKEYEVGRYEFDGGYFMVQKGLTKPMEEGTFEAHRKYIDIQIMIDGSEEVAWADLGDLNAEDNYNEQKDSQHYTGNEKNNILISSGMCYIAFPHDGHKPIRHTKDQQSYTKIVMKLPV